MALWNHIATITRVPFDPYEDDDDDRRTGKYRRSGEYRRSGKSGHFWLKLVVSIVGGGLTIWATLVAADKVPCPQLICQPPVAAAQPSISTPVIASPLVEISPKIGGINTNVEINIVGFEKHEMVVVSLGGRELSWLKWVMNQNGALKLSATPLPNYIWEHISDRVHLPPGPLKFKVTGKTSKRTAYVEFQLTT